MAQLIETRAGRNSLLSVRRAENCDRFNAEKLIIEKLMTCCPSFFLSTFSCSLCLSVMNPSGLFG